MEKHWGGEKKGHQVWVQQWRKNGKVRVVHPQDVPKSRNGDSSHYDYGSDFS